MEKPGFCTLLSFGSAMCILAAIAGGAVIVAGFSNLETNRPLAITYLAAGLASVVQSLVSLGVLQALLWIVGRLLNQDQSVQPVAEQSPVEDDLEPDGIRRKPVLKRRKFT